MTKQEIKVCKNGQIDGTTIPNEKASRATFCRHLKDLPKGVKEGVGGFIPGFDKHLPGTDEYFDVKSVYLVSYGREYGYKVGKGDEFYSRWSHRAIADAERKHICSLTGRPCVARKISHNNASVSKYQAYCSEVELECQLRCPAYEGSLKGSLGKLTGAK